MILYSTSFVFVEVLLKGGRSEQHKGPQSLFVEGLLEGRGVRTTDGAHSLCLYNQEKTKKRDSRFVVPRGRAAEQHKGPQSLFVE